jgi:excinuclease UvrABC ATPase subunit
MTLIPCPKCKGDGYVTDPHFRFSDDSMVECDQCDASGFIEKMPF